MLGSIVIFGREDVGCFKEFVGFRDLLDEARGEGTLQDGEQRVPVDVVHDLGGVGLGTVLEGEVVDPHTPFAIVLLKRVYLGLQVSNGSVLSVDFGLLGCCFAVGFLKEFFLGRTSWQGDL